MIGARQGVQLTGGATRNRTELDGFAIRYITTLPLRRKCLAYRSAIILQKAPFLHLSKTSIAEKLRFRVGYSRLHNTDALYLIRAKRLGVMPYGGEQVQFDIFQAQHKKH